VESILPVFLIDISATLGEAVCLLISPIAVTSDAESQETIQTS
jgi:hypothetical protein